MVRRLLMLNALALIGAVFHHAVVWVLTGMVWWTYRYVPGADVPNDSTVGTLDFYLVRMVDQIASCAVPAFLCVSGYFAAVMLARAHGLDGWRAVAKRVKGLVPPYVLWSCVLLVLQLLQKQCTIEHGVHAGPIRISVDSLREAAWVTGSAILTGSATPPFYYVPLLVQLLALAPLLAPLLSTRPRTVLAVAAFGCATASIARSLALVHMGVGPEHPWLRLVLGWNVLNYGVWFVLGMVVASHMAGFKAFLARIKGALPWALAVTYGVSLVTWEALRTAGHRNWVPGGTILTDDVFALALLLGYFAWDTMPLSGRLSDLGTTSYGVYLAHVPVLELGARAIYHFLPLLLAMPLLFGITLAFAAVALPVLLMIAVDRLALRRYYVYAFG